MGNGIFYRVLEIVCVYFKMIWNNLIFFLFMIRINEEDGFWCMLGCFIVVEREVLGVCLGLEIGIFGDKWWFNSYVMFLFNGDIFEY